MSGRLKVKLLVTLPVGHGGRALDAAPPPSCNQLCQNFWDAGRVSADGGYPISVNPGWEGQKRARCRHQPLRQRARPTYTV